MSGPSSEVTFIASYYCLFWFNVTFNNFSVTMMSDCDSELNAHFDSAASLKDHAPGTRHTTPDHIHYPNTGSTWLYPIKSECQGKRGAASNIFNDFGMGSNL